MRKVYFKLIAMSLALLLSVTTVVMSSYAWLVLSGNPVATGIQVAVGGGNTILTAPNIAYQAADGNTYHYPGRFSDKLNFGQQTNYAYLKSLGKLTPVSTSNGVDWFIPDYYTINDPEVKQGRALTGALKRYSDFEVDSQLSYANLNPENENDVNKISKGSYIYLDFWVVAPGGDYDLQVSTDTGEEPTDSGSFVIDLLMPEPSATSPNGFTLGQPAGSAAAAVRVGFLANDLMLVDDTMLHYQKSAGFDSRFTMLKGMYQEPNTGHYAQDGNHFTIYEPNGDYHPATGNHGGYQETKPLGLVDGRILEYPVDRNLTVQRRSSWAPAENGSGTAIEQQFQTALITLLAPVLDTDDLANFFYGTNLQGQIGRYVNKGWFFKDTESLYAYRNGDGIVPGDKLGNVEQGGATESVSIIRLQRNVPQRIRMFIWLEGQDADCVDGVDSSRFAVNIELAGSDFE